MGYFDRRIGNGIKVISRSYNKRYIGVRYKFLTDIQIKAESSPGTRPFLLPLFLRQNINNMNKGTHFIGQPMYGQLISLLDKSKILKISREKGGERYVKHFDAWQHLVIMLYAVIKRFDSLREITDSMFPEARKFSHLGISMMPRRSTLSDANARRPESIFEETYRDLYATYKDELSSDSRKRSARPRSGLTGFKSSIPQPSRSSPTSYSRVWAVIRRRAGRRAA